jgi:CubicO group peptidase (beta-lactamase class C family)
VSENYWPSENWHTADPESVGMRGDLLPNLERDIAARYRSMTAFLVVRRGKLICERYYGGFDQDDKHLVASVTKSFISALIGIAIDRGFIDDVDQRVLDYFPEYVPDSLDHLKLQITIRDFLTMTAGFQWRTGARNHELHIDRLRRSKDWVAFILGLPVQERLLGTFQYNSATSHLLSAIITRSTGVCAQEFAAKYLFAPLGIDPPATDMRHTYSQADVFRNTSGGWPKDPQGNNMRDWYSSPGIWPALGICTSWVVSGKRNRSFRRSG